ncbi:uncharacterized protein LOC124116815 [Haliotis rufescens]|uniref:uncharacterized protein LOC124116815 n=1 Tax=Haliotis rufescens TaxID=6454 RepID=UPI001EB002AF|nr:uncharacterized protein LOC124116815 [Haliotis rufescens]
MASVFGAAAIPFIACIALLLAESLQILSFAAPYWASDQFGSFGLWRHVKCVGGSNIDCYQYEYPWHVDVWLNAVRAMESIAIIFIAIPLVVMPVYIYVALGLYYRCVLLTMTVFALLASLCNISGVVVYGVTIGQTPDWAVGWCLIVCIIGAGFDFIGFLVLLIAAINKPNFSPERFTTSGYYVDHDSNKLYAVEGVERDMIRTDVSQFGGHSNPGLDVE